MTSSMTRPYRNLSDEDLARVAANPSDNAAKRDAVVEANYRREAYLADLDPAAFEGDAESGPRSPLAPIDIVLSEGRVERITGIATSGLRSLHLRLPAAFEKPGMTLMDVCFRIAGEAGCSPLYVRRLATQLNLAPAPDVFEERAIIYRMDLESEQAAAAARRAS